jgi:glycerol-3-phosphate O-acyltransferase
LATSAWAAATSADPGEALAETELLEAVELLELLLEEQAASSAAAVRAAAGAARRFHVRVMLKFPPSTGHGEA